MLCIVQAVGGQEWGGVLIKLLRQAGSSGVSLVACEMEEVGSF